MTKRWSVSDDAKLLSLFRQPRGGVNPTKLSVADVKAVHAKHFAEHQYVNFAPLYREKARSFQTSRTLNGHRKRKCFYPFTTVVS